MPRTRSVAWSELKVGILGVIALALVVFLVFAVGGEGGFWWDRYPLKTRFTNAQGLKSGAVVRLNGKEVGTVTSVEFAGPQVEVGFEVLKSIRPLVTTESTSEVGSLGLLGAPVVDITASQAGRALNDWEYVKAGVSGASFDQLTATASTSLKQIDGLLSDVRKGQGTLGKFVTDDGLYREMESFVASAAQVTKAMNTGRGTISSLVNDPAAYSALKASLENLQAMTARINTGQGALAKFLNDEAMGRSMAGATTNVEQITGRLSRGEGTAGKLLTDQQLYDRLNSMTSKVEQVLAGLDAGRGTAGQLLQDQRLYENMNRAVNELQALLGDIRKDPKKYLRVNVSIF